MIVKHRRGTTEEWRENNVIPEAGELVIEECSDGTRRAKFGTGYQYFSDLPYIDDKLWEEIDSAKTDLNIKITSLDKQLSRELKEAKNSIEARLDDEVDIRNKAIEKLINDVINTDEALHKSILEVDETLTEKITTTSDNLQTSIEGIDTKINVGITSLKGQVSNLDSIVTGKFINHTALFDEKLSTAVADVKDDYNNKINELAEELQATSEELSELAAQSDENKEVIADFARDAINKIDYVKTALKTQIAEQSRRIDNLIVPSEGEPITDVDLINAVKDLQTTGTATREAVSTVDEKVQDLRDSLSQYIGTQAINGLYYDKDGSVGIKAPYMLYLTANREVLTDTGVQIISGSGSGAGNASGTSSLNIYRITPQDAIFNASDKVILEFRFSGKDSSEETITRAEAEWYFNGEPNPRAKSTVRDGDNDFDITQYLAASETLVKLVVRDGNGSIATKEWTVTRVELALTSDFNDKKAYTAGESFVFTYTPTGTINKKLFIKLDGELLKLDAASDYTAELSADVSGQTLPYENASAFTSLTHGVHTLEAYLEATINGATTPTHPIFKEIIVKDSNSTLPLIGATTQTVYGKQYATINIVYTVYDPGREQPLVDIFLDDSPTPVVHNKEITLNPKYFNTPTAEYTYNALEAGVHTVKIVCGEVSRTVNISIDGIDTDLSPVTTGLAFDFNPALGDNSKSWEDHGVTMSYSTNFDWTNGGYKIDENGDPYFCVKAGTTATINYELFADNNAKSNGKEFKVIFKTTNVRQRDTSFLKCLSDNIGIDMRVENATVYDGSTSSLRTDYCEDAIIEYEFNINKATDMMIVMSYEDGTPSKPYEYTSSSSFTQKADERQPIIIGSEDCDVHIYRIKAYKQSLLDTDIKKNFIADARNLDEKLARFNRNNIYDDGKLITTAIDGSFSVGSLMKAAPDLRYVFLEVPQFTNDKDNKIDGCTVYFRYPAGTRPQDNWTCTGVRHRGQGTSSNTYGYAGRNIDLCMDRDESLFTWQEKDANGNDYTQTGSKITLTDTSVPTDYLNIKVNIASSENTNNAELVRRFNEYQPFKRYARKKDSRVKDTMEFYNCVVFIRETSSTLPHREFDDTNWHFYAIGNIGDSKKTDDTRVNNAQDPKEHVVEIMDADAAKAPLFAFPRYIHSHSYKYLDASGHDQTMEFESTTDVWAPGNAAYDILYSNNFNYKMNDKNELEFKSFGSKSFEFRYEMSKISAEQRLDNINAWRNFYNFVVTATDDEFYNNLKDYFVVDSALYYYLFTERYTMVDNRAKNSFWHYGKVYISNEEAAVLGEKEASYYLVDDAAAAINNGYRYDLTFGYDMDTALGIDNTGDYVFAYGKEDTDHYQDDPTAPAIFRAHDSTFFCRLRDLFSVQLRTKFQDCDKAGAWDATNGDKALIPRWDKVQAQFPEELWRLDYERKYYRPYRGVSIDGSISKGIDPDFLTTKFFGRKKYARRAFEINQEIYFATKYFGSKAILDVAKWRGTAPEATAPDCGINYSVTLVPYSDMYLCIQRGGASGEDPEHSIDYNGKPLKIKAGEPYTFTSSAIKADFIYIYAAGWLQAIGDISRSYVDEVLTGPVTRLQSLVLGNNTAGYSNNALKKVDVTQNVLLEYLDLSNVTGLDGELDLTANINLKTLKADGTTLSSVSFAPGGKIAQVELPITVSKIELKDLKYLSADPPTNDPDASYFDLPDANNVQSLTIENCPNFTLANILDKFSCTDDSDKRVLKNIRLTGMSFGNYTYNDFIADFDSLGGIDINGDQTPKAWLEGTIHFTGTLTGAQYNYISTNYSELDITYDRLESSITFMDTDLVSIIHTNTSVNGASCSNPVYYDSGEIPEGMIAKPIKAPSENGEFKYEFLGWSTSQNTIVSVEDESDPLTDEKRMAFREVALKHIEGDRVLYPVFEKIRLEYNVTFINPTAPIDSANYSIIVENVPYGSDAVCPWDKIPKLDVVDSSLYVHNGWSNDEKPTGANLAITGNTICYALFRYANADVLDFYDLYQDSYPDEFGTATSGNSYRIDEVNKTIEILACKPIIGTQPATSVTVPEQLTIGETDYSITTLGGFYNQTKLVHVKIADTVTELGTSAFKNCVNLCDVEMPTELKSIGQKCFNKCTALTKLAIPGTVHTIGVDAFTGCSKLHTFDLGNNHQYFAEQNNCLIDKANKTLLFGKFVEGVDVPDSDDVTSLQSYCFAGNTLLPTDITISSKITSVGQNAFSGTKVKSVVFNNANTTIGSTCFDGCASLSSITLPSNIQTIPTYAFNGCSLSSVNIPASITTIQQYSFGHLSNATITFADGVNLGDLLIDNEASKGAFEGATNITFNLPWTKDAHTDKFGSATEAWGATNVTFNFKEA